jgi:hypothetical protein
VKLEFEQPKPFDEKVNTKVKTVQRSPDKECPFDLVPQAANHHCRHDAD